MSRLVSRRCMKIFFFVSFVIVFARLISVYAHCINHRVRSNYSIDFFFFLCYTNKLERIGLDDFFRQS